MTALASLGVLTKDDGIVEAVLAEIDERGIDQPDPEGSLAYLRSLVKLSKVSPVSIYENVHVGLTPYCYIRMISSEQREFCPQRYIGTRPTSRQSYD
jgi:hypothetical protein